MKPKALIRRLLRNRGFEIVRASSQASLLGLHLANLFQHLGINCVLDVGGGVGEYATWLRNNGYQGFIASFEPVAARFRALQSNSKGDPKWATYKLALGARNEAADINVYEYLPLSSFRTPSEYSLTELGAGIEVRGIETVEVRRLDSIYREVVSAVRNPRVFLKMDTQGWDLEVLKGANGCLDQVLGLQSEVSVKALYQGMPHFMESLSSFEQQGLALSGLFPVLLDSDMAVIELDCVMVRPAQPPQANPGKP